MSRFRELVRRLRWSFERSSREAELGEELQFHLEQSAKEKAAAGASPGDAERQARRRLGNATLIRESSRDAWLFAGAEGLFRDFAYGVRQLRQSPAFAAATIVSLALGIGAVATVFSLVDAVVLRRLPVREPERLVMFANPSFSGPVFMEVNRRAELLEGLFGWSNERLTVDWGDRTEAVPGLLALGPYHETLGVQAQIGRMLTPDDDRPGRGLASVISVGCWRARFGRDPAVLDQTLRIDGAAYTIVGVTPRGFFGTAPGLDPEVTISAASLPMRHPGASDLLSPTNFWLHMMARLKPGVSFEQANAELQLDWPEVKKATVPADASPEFRQRYLNEETTLLSAATGFSSVRNQFQESLWLLFGLVSLLFAVACASVANLMSARMTKRRRELAVRTAIGAGRGRVLRQAVMEGLLMAGLAALGGLAISTTAAVVVADMLSTSDSPIALDLTPDARILGFTLLATALAAVLCILIPTVRSTAADPNAALKQTRVVGARRDGLSAPMVTAQVALSVVLLSGCALFLRSLDQVLSKDGGFERGPLIIVSPDPIAAGYRGPRLASWYHSVVERVRSLPNVDAASFSWNPPVSNEKGYWWSNHTTIDGKPAEEENARTYLNMVSPDYFATIGTKLLQGRTFTALDSDPPAAVVIINEELAHTYFGNDQPVGRFITLGRNEDPREIVGVVENSSYRFLQEPTTQTAFRPFETGSEMLEASNLTLEVRARGPARLATADVSEAIRALDSTVSYRLETMEDRIAESLVREIALAKLASVLGGLSLILAVAGLYGLLAYGVARRTNELGVRIALGASNAGILRMVLGDAGRLTALGLVAGIALFASLARFASGLVHGVSPADPWAMAISGALMLGTALLAAWGPARQASRVNPVDAMRQE